MIFSLKVQYGSLLYISLTFHHTVMIGEEAIRKYFWHFFSCDYDFTIAMGEGLYLVLATNTKCIFYRFQTLNVISNVS